MTHLKLEVGKRYKINLASDDRFPVIRKLVYQNDKAWVFEDSNNEIYGVPKKIIFEKFGYEIIEHIEEPMQEKIKLEVGKKYNFPIKKDLDVYNPQKFLCYDGDYAIFRTKDGRIVSYLTSLVEIAEITEHREMIKYSEEGWFNYLGKTTDGFPWVSHVHKAKQDALDDSRYCSPRPEQIYGRFTFEQLLEPEET